MKRKLLQLLGLGVMSGCVGAQPKGKSVSTVVVNYTDRYIADVIVDGIWSGAADAYSGLGNRVQGLLAPSDPNRVAVLKVKWVVADVYDVASNTYSRRADEPHEASVEVARPYPGNPRLLVLHFYPDGHVEAELEADQPKRRIPPPAGYHR